MVKKVSVIIPTLDRGEVLVNTLKDLLKQEYPDLEIIVVDQTDNPSREVLNFVGGNKNIIKYIHLKKKNSPHARNVGVANATGEILLFLDDDVEIRDPNFIKYHLDNYQSDQVGLVGGRVVYNWRDNISYREVGRLKYFGLKEVTHFDSIVKTEIDHAPGGNCSCRRDIFERVGGFSEIYKGNAHMEETDFCLRIKRAGYQLVFEPKAVLRHLQSQTGGNRVKDIYEFRYWLVHNYVVFYLKNFPKILFPLCYLKEFFWATGSAVKRGDFKMFKTMFRGLNDGVKYYQQLKKEGKLNEDCH